MSSEALFGWVHLSDVHIGHGGASHRADQELVLRALREDIAEQVKAGAVAPDVVLVTGDVAFSGACAAADEYERAAAWLAEVAAAAGVAREAVFVVPGNHDVQRPVDKESGVKRMLRALRTGDETVDEALQNNADRAVLARRQANYLAFAERFAPAGRADAATREPRLYWHHEFVAREGLRVRLCGINTALLAADEATFGTDQGALCLGKRQLADVLPGANDPSELVVVLSHHPFVEGWLRDEKEARLWTRNHAHVHLSGHVHEAANERTRTGVGGDFVHVAAGAAHGEAAPAGTSAQHGYSFGEVVKGKAGVALRVWPRRWSEARKRFWLDPESVDSAKGYVAHALPRVKLPKAPAATQPKEAKPKRTSAPSAARVESEPAGPPTPHSRPPTDALELSARRSLVPRQSLPENVARAVSEVVELLRDHPAAVASLKAQGLGDDARTIADALFARSGHDVAMGLTHALDAIGKDRAASDGDRRALERLFNECLRFAADWRALAAQGRDALPDDPAAEARANAVDLPLSTETLAELVSAAIDARLPAFELRDNVPVGLTCVQVPMILRAPALHTEEGFHEAIVRHLAALPEFRAVMQRFRDPTSPKATKALEESLHTVGYEFPVGRARPYYVVIGDEDPTVWQVAQDAQRSSRGLKSLRLIRLSGGAVSGEFSILQFVREYLGRTRSP
ncbi:MAG: metallophosphoesterase [Polyangiales bacterium]